jgi:hypothetical protein
VNRAVADDRTPAGPARATQRNWLSDATQAIRGLVPKPSIPVSHSSSTGAR